MNNIDDNYNRSNSNSDTVVIENPNSSKDKGSTFVKAQTPRKRKNKMSTAKILFVSICIISIVFFLIGKIANRGSSSLDGSVNINYLIKYVAVIDVNGEIDSTNSSSNSSYNHAWTMDTLDKLIKDKTNKGLIIRINSPGGSIYPTDELYEEILKYKATGRPVYCYMQSMAASGGYYIAAPSDKIYANKNCWTGSIGVTTGTMYDVSGLLSKYGIKTETITSGKNKSMGSSTTPLTKEQRRIYKSLIDEAYNSFVKVVASGRKMSVSKVKSVADGRVYSATQAKELGLIDGVCSEEVAINSILQSKSLKGCKIHYLQPSATSNMLSSLESLMKKKNSSSELSNYDQLLEILDGGNRFDVSYKAEITK